jgi:hypothetical protein
MADLGDHSLAGCLLDLEVNRKSKPRFSALQLLMREDPPARRKRPAGRDLPAHATTRPSGQIRIGESDFAGLGLEETPRPGQARTTRPKTVKRVGQLEMPASVRGSSSSLSASSSYSSAHLNSACSTRSLTAMLARYRQCCALPRRTATVLLRVSIRSMACKGMPGHIRSTTKQKGWDSR